RQCICLPTTEEIGDECGPTGGGRYENKFADVVFGKCAVGAVGRGREVELPVVTGLFMPRQRWRWCGDWYAGDVVLFHRRRGIWNGGDMRMGRGDKIGGERGEVGSAVAGVAPPRSERRGSFMAHSGTSGE